MSYTAILFMCNDEKRAEFVIENFKKHNPEIHLIVYNGGNSAQFLKEKYDIELIEGSNLWHKKTRNPPGSFSYEWFELLFSIGLKMKTEHLIFLETDVKVTRKIEKEPIYEISGPTTTCGHIDSLVAYDYWGGYLKGTMHDDTDWKHKLHTGMGGTVFKKSFFHKCMDNLKYVKQAYELIPFNCYQDLQITLLGRYSDCSFGDWSEVSDTRGMFRKIDDEKWYREAAKESCALIHNFKI